ncbi:hypothetical protein FHW67_003279 [Herbaspirillum sp. Sphag1AN]|nr:MULTISPECIES: DUF6622 family protein [unclassified Herbaspirillum]MBB3213973.1 hypothetical protein [Herbaspirillum sp. Sphag1AN]MBB3247170.1 hypothetical protein [Herbaspirillum sp. Sphag64]
MMLLSIISHTPLWVWVLLVFLFSRGISALAHRDVSLRKVIVIPVIMLMLSLHGLLSLFENNIDAMSVAAGAALLSALLAWQRTARTVEVSQAGRVRLRGSILPLLLMMAIFVIKYSAGVLAVMHPMLFQAGALPLLLAMVYGLFAGTSIGRVLQILHLYRLAQRPMTSLIG